MSPGIPPGPVRSTMLGGVRADSHTLRAPPSARSCAISMPEQPGPHHQHDPVREWLGVPVFAGVRQLALEQVAPRPIGHGRLRLVPGGDDHLGDADLAGGGAQRPATVRALDPVDLRSELEVDPVLARVLVEMLHELVPRGEHRSPLREAAPGQVGIGPAGVQAQPVVAGAPRRCHLVRLVDQERPQPPVLESHGGRHSGGPGADHRDLWLGHMATINDHPARRPSLPVASRA